jgi:hypothetical protein
MLALFEFGAKVAARRLAQSPDKDPAHGGVVDASVFGLLGLLLAFTFSGAADRFNHRRLLITQEANAIGTAWLRIDMLPAAAQPAIRDGFRRYLDARLAIYDKLPDEAAAAPEIARTQRELDDLWAKAVAVARTDSGVPARMLLLPTMNEMFDLAEERMMALRMHPPVVIWLMLIALALVASLLAGYGMPASGKRNWLHMLAFVGTTAIAIFVIMDLEYPRRGFIQVKDFDQVLVDLRASMKWANHRHKKKDGPERGPALF